MAHLAQGFSYPQYFNPSEKRLSESVYCWDEQDGFRMFPMSSMQTTNIQMSNMRSANPRRPVRKPLPLRIPEVAETTTDDAEGYDGRETSPGRISPGDTSGRHQVNESARSHSRSSMAESPTSPLFSHPVFAPSPTPRESPVPFALNRTPSLPNQFGKCICGNPEPVIKRSHSLGGFGGMINHRNNHSRANSSATCVCKFSPTVEDARLMLMPSQSARPRVVSHRQQQRPRTALPDMGEAASWSNRPISAHSPGTAPQRQASLWPSPHHSVREVYPDDLEAQTQPPMPTRHHHQRIASHYPLFSPPLRAPSTTTQSVRSLSQPDEPSRPPSILVGQKPPHDQLRRSLFHWSLVRLISDILLLAASLTMVILLVWPAVEQSRFPVTNYAFAPQVITITHKPTNGRPGPRANITSTTTEVQLAKIGTADVPAAVLEHDAILSEQASVAEASTTKNGTGTGNQKTNKKGEPDGYFAMGPFWRTFHAEFRKHGFPALLIGLASLAVLQLAGNIFEAVSLSPQLERRDEYPLVRSKRSVLFAKSTAKTLREWKRGVGWTEHRGQCVIAAKVKGLFATVRSTFVVTVLIVLVCLSDAKVRAGNAAP